MEASQHRFRREDLWPGEFEDLFEQAKDLLWGDETYARYWMDRTHWYLGHRTPNQAIAQDDTQLVRDLFRMMRWGGPY